MNIAQFLDMQNQLQIQMRLVNRDLEGSPLYMLTNEQKLSFLRWNHSALIIELSEAMEETGWKPWASSRHMNYAGFIKEMVDGWHFFMNMLLVAAAIEGKTLDEVGDDFTQEYITKNAKNLRRQMEGYDGITGKCPRCNRELSDAPAALLTACMLHGDESTLQTFCTPTCHQEWHREQGEAMDPDHSTEALQADIEQRSAQRPGSGTPEDLSDAVKEAHLAKQGATSPAAFQGDPPFPTEFQDPADLPIGQEIHEIDQRMGESAEEQAARSKNPHAFRMVMNAEKTGEPLFCFRARDFFSVQVISHYENLVAMYGPDDAEFHRNIIDALDEFKTWQKQHQTEVRYPD
jgi:hypothetical protein